jgi:hypothetical protein
MRHNNNLFFFPPMRGVNTRIILESRCFFCSLGGNKFHITVLCTCVSRSAVNMKTWQWQSDNAGYITLSSWCMWRHEDMKSKINILTKKFTNSFFKIFKNCTVLSILIRYFYQKLHTRVTNVVEWKAVQESICTTGSRGFQVSLH